MSTRPGVIAPLLGCARSPDCPALRLLVHLSFSRRCSVAVVVAVAVAVATLEAVVVSVVRCAVLRDAALCPSVGVWGMSGGFFRGTSVSQDARFADKASLLLQSLRFPSVYRRKVDLSLVRLDEVSRWVQRRVVELVGLEDEVLVGLVVSTLSQARAAKREVDPRQLQLDLTGFLSGDAEAFTSALWQLLLDQQPTAASPAPPPPLPPPSTAPPPASSASAPRRSRFGPPLAQSLSRPTLPSPPLNAAAAASQSPDVAARSTSSPPPTSSGEPPPGAFASASASSAAAASSSGSRAEERRLQRSPSASPRRNSTQRHRRHRRRSEERSDSADSGDSQSEGEEKRRPARDRRRKSRRRSG